MSERQAYRLTLRVGPGLTDEQATRALRSALKWLLRVHGLRCVALEPVAVEPVEPPGRRIASDKGQRDNRGAKATGGVRGDAGGWGGGAAGCSRGQVVVWPLLVVNWHQFRR